MKRLSTSSASKNIAGEPNPGFHLWTSSHGFHHLTVTQEPAWKFFWTFVLTVLTISLVGCIIYYFYYVFAFAVFSRVTQETPNVINWPVTILCDRQIFSSYKMTQMQPLTSAHVSLLTWSIHPSLTRPDFIAQGKIGQLSMDINTLMQNKFGGSYIVPGNGYGSGSGGAYGSGSGGAYGSGSGGAYGSGGGGAYGSGGGPSGGNGGGWYGGGGYGGGGYGGGGYLNGNGPYPSMDMSAPQGGPLDLLLRAIAPNCTNLILQCTFGNTSINGFDCCARYFDPVPYITQYGTCFSTRGGRMRHSVRMAGDADSFTIVTLHESSTTFYDQTIVSPKIYGANGLAFAIAADNMTVIEALNQLQTVQPGNYASVGLSKTVIDNRDLEWSAIARSKCFTPGARKSFYVDDDMLYSIDKRYGYSRGACQMISKPEMISRELLYCTFNPVQFDNLTRCNSNQSLSFYQMFQDPNIPPMMMLQRLDAKMGLRKRYQRPCRPDCYEEKFAMSPTFFPKSSADLQIYQTYATANGLGTPGGQMTPIILKLYMTSMEYQRIYNFPQPGLQFIAEIGGLMCFFLGISLVSVIECLCYCCCCGCRSDDEE